MIAQSDNPISPFDAIATKFNRLKKDQPLSPDDSSNNSPSDSIDHSIKKNAHSPGPIAFGSPPLISPESIKSPALILSHDLRIIWQNAAAGPLILQQQNLQGGGC